MEAILDYYLQMGYFHIHVIEIIVLVIIQVLILKFKSVEGKRVRFHKNIQLFLMVFMACIFLLNIYLWYHTYELSGLIELPTKSEHLQLHYEQSDKGLYPYLISQIVIIFLTLALYVKNFRIEKNEISKKL